MDVDEIKKLLPHRYPFLFVDRITQLDATRVEGCKNVTINEPFFVGHFPDFPIMPGVLILEALAQTCGVMLLHNNPEKREKLPLFLGVDRARFRKPVRPGDVLRLTGEIVGQKDGVCKLSAKAFVGDILACDAVLTVGWGDKA
jgi:3-hydroxyacyl-[acyl-carrier-protein] dehydratase